MKSFVVITRDNRNVLYDGMPDETTKADVRAEAERYGHYSPIDVMTLEEFEDYREALYANEKAHS